MTDQPHIPSEDLALLALGALSPEETAAAQAHLAICAECRREVAELRGDAALLALSVPQQPLPAAARERFLSSIGATSSAQPISQQPAQPISSAPTPVAAVTAAPSTPTVIPMPVRTAASSGATRFWQAIAAVLVLALGYHAWKVHDLQGRIQADNSQIAALKDSNDTLTTNSAKARQVLETLTARNAQHVLLAAAHVAPEPEGRLTYIADTGSLILLANHLKPLPAGKTYELWIIPTTGAPIPAGTFEPDTAGNGRVVLPQIPQGIQAKAFGVTLEAAGGAQTPTMPILISGAAS